jgi:RNA polymerase sigma-70 factor (ECF subfamily)
MKAKETQVNLIRRDEIKKLVKTPFLVQEAMRTYGNLTDEQLILRFQEGDLAAFDVIVGRYKEPLISFVIQFVRERSDAEDIVQDTFVKVFKHKQLYRQIARFSTWIHTVARNFARSEIRKKTKYRPHSISSLMIGDQELAVAVSDNRPDDLNESPVKNAIIRQAINELSDTYRDIIRLRELEHLPYDQIAGRTGLPVGTIKSRVNRGRAILQKKLSSIMDQI